MQEEFKTRVTNVRRQDVGISEACFVMIYPTGTQLGVRFPLSKERLVIGRGQDCDIQVDLDSVSRNHASIIVKKSEIHVEDLGSTNGTYINEQLIKSKALSNGDLVQTGNAIFKFLTGGNVEADYHEAIYRMTIIDGLTGVFNKRYLLDFLEREVARCMRYSRPLSLVMFDLDHFKEINDNHGHLTGDHVLRELCRRIQSRIRKEELLARYGGEEFIVVLPEALSKGAIAFAEQLRKLVAEDPVVFEGDTIHTTISAGVSTICGDTVTVDQFIRTADENLYIAKNAGRNRVAG